VSLAYRCLKRKGLANLKRMQNSESMQNPKKGLANLKRMQNSIRMQNPKKGLANLKKDAKL
tara:strand:+ start:271 stop:453 length:183 start_codon:yes stop_codon:yes gene_type:complete